MRRTDKLAVAAVVAVVVVSPWPLGSRLPWAHLLFSALTIGVGAWWLASRLWTGAPIRAPAGTTAGGLFLAWIGLQWMTGATIYSHATALGWVARASYLLLFILVANLARDERTAQRFQYSIVYSAIAVSVFGLVQFYAQSGGAYSFLETPFLGTPFGPFNNRNYFGGYVAATLPMIVATASLMQSGKERTGLYAGSFLAGWALLLNISRGAIIAAGAALAYQYIALKPRRATDRSTRGENPIASRRRWVPATVVVALLLAIVWSGQADRVVSRIESIPTFTATRSMQDRVTLWRDTLPMIADRPVAGFGLDTYLVALPSYRTVTNSAAETNAHNEYLEILVETGVVGAALCAAFLLALFINARRRLAETRGPAEFARRVGASAGWLAILVFAMVDFPTIIPAINYSLAVMAGLMVADG